MEKKIKAIVLTSVKYSDRHNIVSLYSDSLGRVSVMAPASSSSRKTLSRRKSLVPLSVIETEIRYNPAKDIQLMHSFSVVKIWQNIYFDPMKNAIGVFLTEFLSRLLYETSPEPKIWRFILASLNLLDNISDPHTIANFHLSFCLQMLHFTGIAPDVNSNYKSDYFDMRAGIYVNTCPPHNDVIGKKYSHLPHLLLRMTFDNMRLFRFSKFERGRILDGILYYYALHLPGINNMKSPKILKELF